MGDGMERDERQGARGDYVGRSREGAKGRRSSESDRDAMN